MRVLASRSNRMFRRESVASEIGKSTSSPVLGSGSFTPCGRTLSQVAIASPTMRSTGLVKEVLVLFTGTSSMQTASARRVSPVLGTVTSCFCHRMQPRRKRRISLLRRPANSQVRASALHISTGYACGRLVPSEPGPILGRSSAVRFRPAQTSLAQMSSAIARGFGPIRASRLLGVVRLRAGSNLRGIRSHSCRSRKNMRRMEMRSALVLGASALPRLLTCPGSGLHQSPPCHWQMTDMACPARSRVQTAGEATSGCTWASQRPMLSRK